MARPINHISLSHSAYDFHNKKISDTDLKTHETGLKSLLHTAPPISQERGQIQHPMMQIDTANLESPSLTKIEQVRSDLLGSKSARSFQNKLKNVNAELVVKFISIPDQNGDIPIHDPERFEKAFPVLMELAKGRESDRILLINLLSLEDQDGHTPLYHPKIFEDALPLLTEIAKHQPELLKDLPQAINRKSPLHSPEIFTKALPLLKELAKGEKSEHTLLINLLSAQNRNGSTPLHNPAIVKQALPMMLELATNQPDLLKRLFLIQNQSGDTPIFSPKIIEQALPLLTELAISQPALLKDLLSIRDLNGLTPLHHSEIVEQALPLLTELATTQSALLKDLLSTQDLNGFTPLHYPEIIQKILPLLTELATSQPHLFKDLLSVQTTTGNIPLSIPEIFNRATSLLCELAENQPDLIKELFSVQNRDGDTPLHDPWIFQEFQQILPDIDVREIKSSLGMTPLDSIDISVAWLTKSKLSAEFHQEISQEDFSERIRAVQESMYTLWSGVKFGEEEGEVSDSYLLIAGQQNRPEDLLDALDKMLNTIANEEVWQGTPQEGADVHKFYSEMLVNLESLIGALQKESDPQKIAGPLIQIGAVAMEGRCGAAYQGEIAQAAAVATSGARGESLADVIEKTASSVVLATIEKYVGERYNRDVHVLTQYMHVVGLAANPDLTTDISPEMALQDIWDILIPSAFVHSFNTLVPPELTSTYLEQQTPVNWDVEPEHRAPGGVGFLELKKMAQEGEESLFSKTRGELTKFVDAENVDRFFDTFRGLNPPIVTADPAYDGDTISAVIKAQTAKIKEKHGIEIDLTGQFDADLLNVRPPTARSDVRNALSLIGSAKKFDQEMERWSIGGPQRGEVAQHYRAYAEKMGALSDRLGKIADSSPIDHIDPVLGGEPALSFSFTPTQFRSVSQAIEQARIQAYNRPYPVGSDMAAFRTLELSGIIDVKRDQT